MPAYELTVAPNGARRQKTDHSELPITVEEIAFTARACFLEGANKLHLHVREENGDHSLDAGRYRDAMAAVGEAAPRMSIQITTESAGRYCVADQLSCLQALRPSAASIAVKEMARDPILAARVYALTADTGTQVQHILYGPSCISQYLAWHSDGTIPKHQNDVIFVLGKYHPAILAKPSDVRAFLSIFNDKNLHWTICAFGRHEQACLLEAIRLGGNARIGFENNIETPEGTPLASNAAAVSSLVSAAKAKNHHPQEN